VNPFLVPGCSDPRAPLDPPVSGTDADYVPVDHTQHEFERFQQEIEDGESVIRDGRLVIATGPVGCGKTALINRCVKWLGSETGPAWREIVVDLRRDHGDRVDRERRRRLVSSRLVDELRQRQALGEDSRAVELHKDPDRMYPMLSQELGKSVLVLLLPPSGDLVDELIDYARLVRARLLLFAETAYPRRVARRQEEIYSTGGSVPLILKLDKLRDHDGRLYADTRLHRFAEFGAWPLGGDPPPVAQGSLETLVTERPMFIGELQQTLHGVYDIFLTEGTQPQQVSEADFMRWYVRRTATDGGDS
jgi:hypothetical protein